MNIPRPADRRAAGALPGVLVAVVSALNGCANKDTPGVFLEFRAENPQYRPEAIRFTWMRAGAELVNARLPEVGTFTSEGPLMGSIFIETGGPLSEPRLLAAKGMRGDSELAAGQMISGAVAVVPSSPDPVQRWAVLLTEPLADENGDGKPDVVQRDCLRAGWRTCLEMGPGPGLPDGGVDGNEPGVDTGVPADMGAPTDAGGGSLELGLIGHWRLDEGMGTQARDSSGSNNHGTLRNLPNSAWMPGKNGTGLEIPDSENSAVFVPSSDSLDSPRAGFTLAAWTFRMEHQQAYATVASRRFGTGGSEHYLLGFQNGTAKALFNTHLPPGQEATLTGTAQAPLFTWVHLALTFDGSALRLFQDGKVVASMAYARPLVTDRTPLCIGCNQNGPGDTANDESLAGRVDEVVLYSRALNATEIGRLAAGELPATP